MHSAPLVPANRPSRPERQQNRLRLDPGCLCRDREAENGPLATAWPSNKFLDPITDGAVLPILHLNGYKISNPTLLARIAPEELEQFFRGRGWTPYLVEGDEPESMHQLMADPLDQAMIVPRSPKGWTGATMVDGVPHLGTKGACLKQLVQDRLIEHRHDIAKHGQDLPEIRNWMWRG